MCDCKQPRGIQQAVRGAGVATDTPVLASRTPYGRALTGPSFGVTERLAGNLVCLWDF